MARWFKRFVLSALAVAGAVGPAGAFVVSGQVVNEQGAGIPLVDLDFFDRDLGQIIFTPGDDTDANGFYSVDVPAAEYDIFYNAPAGSPYLDVEIREVVDQNLSIDVTLPTALSISGYVTDQANGPLYNVDLDYISEATGDEIVSGIPNDNSDLTGFYQALLPADTYELRYTPPLGAPYAAAVVPGVLLEADLVMDTIRLEPGFAVSGNLIDPLAAPVENADLNFEVSATGAAVYTPRDNSDALGAFSVLVAAGTYDIVFRPPTGSGLAYAAAYDVPVAANTALGTIALEPGYTVSGTVVDGASAPVAGGDLDMIDVSTRIEIPTDQDGTDPSGVFQMLAPARTMDVYVKPPVGAPLAATVLRDQVISGNTNLGTISLLPGFRISGVVRNTSGNPVALVDMDLVEAATLLPYPTVNDDTDGAGAYEVRAPAGGYILIANPDPASGYLPDTVVVDPLNSDRVIDFVLPSTFTVGVAEAAPAPASLSLANVPNPFNPTTEIRFVIPGAGERSVTLDVYAPEGRRVRSLLRSTLGPGSHSVFWDGRDDGGSDVGSGVYFYRLEAGALAETRKMILMR